MAAVIRVRYVGAVGSIDTPRSVDVYDQKTFPPLVYRLTIHRSSRFE